MKYFRKILIIILAFYTAVPLAAAPIRQKVIQKIKYCNLYDLMTGNRFKTVLQEKSTTASGKNAVCIFYRNQRRMSCNNMKIELLNTTVYDKKMPWLSTLDWFKTLRPILYPATVSRKKIDTVMIDMGHGGSDPGAIGKISKEKMITLRVGLRVAQLLRAYGFKVNLTRTSDVQVPLAQIGAMQTRTRSDLFISIHVNAAADRSVNGVETFCLTPAGAASSNGGKVSATVYKGNKQDDANMLLAWKIQSAVLKRTKAADRGIKRARFAVLRDITVPGVLVEIGFISNTAEERRLNDRNYVDKIAYGIVEGIVGFTKSTKPRN